MKEQNMEKEKLQKLPEVCNTKEQKITTTHGETFLVYQKAFTPVSAFGCMRQS